MRRRRASLRPVEGWVAFATVALEVGQEPRPLGKVVFDVVVAEDVPKIGDVVFVEELLGFREMVGREFPGELRVAPFLRGLSVQSVEGTLVFVRAVCVRDGGAVVAHIRVYVV